MINLNSESMSSGNTSCLDVCDDDRSLEEQYSAVDMALRADDSPPPSVGKQSADIESMAFYDASRRSWVIRVQGQEVVEVVPKETKDSQLYKLYWEANSQLIALGMKLEGTQGELQHVLRTNEKLNLENMMLAERVNRLSMENKLQSYEQRKESEEHRRDYEDLKSKYHEYRQTTKTLVTHMNQQKKKSKKGTE